MPSESYLRQFWGSGDPGDPLTGPLMRTMIIRLAERGGVIGSQKMLWRLAGERPDLRDYKRAARSLWHAGLLSEEPRHWLRKTGAEFAVALTRSGWHQYHNLRDITGPLMCDQAACVIDAPERCDVCNFSAGMHEVELWVHHSQTEQHRRLTWRPRDDRRAKIRDPRVYW